jgi:uncharacterized protein YciW
LPRGSFSSRHQLGIHSEAIAEIFSGSKPEHVAVRLQPVLAFVCKLTLSPGEITSADIDAIFAAGWDDRAVHNAVAICALFNLMNRLVNGLGVEAAETYIKMAAKRLADVGYAKLLGSLPAPKSKPGISAGFRDS